MDNKYIEKANILIEALPYIRRLAGKTVVIKYGGAAMLSEDLSQKIMQDITLLKYVGVNPIVVHGGGSDINDLLKKYDIEPRFHNGLRVTDPATMEVVQMVLTGKINKEIVSQLGVAGAKAIGCAARTPADTGGKAGLGRRFDYGRVGKITGINANF